MKIKQNNKSFKIYQIIGIVVLCLSLIMISYRVTTAWFMDESVTSNGEPNISIIGTIDLDVTTNFDFYNLALAPDTIYTTDQDGADIGTYLKTSTNNDIREVYVRIKYTKTRNDSTLGAEVDCPELTLYFDGNLTTATTYSMAVNNMWVYNSTDGYYYYLGSIGSINTQFNAGYATDNTFNNAKASSQVYIKLEVEAIQRPYGAYKAVWDTAPTIFNEFALADSGV
ncbi:MAG: hypothetical protein ACI4PF_00155 [Christensenellales bacterium]